MVFAVGLAGACGGGETEPEFRYPAQADFCRAAAEAACNTQVVQACYGSDDASLATDRDACIAARSRANTCNPLSLPYHPEEAERCVASYRAVWADAALDRGEVASLRESCLSVFSRGGKDGTSCTIDEDCDTGEGLRCVTKPGAPTGKCGTPAEVGGGVDCSAANAECADGFFCDAESSACLQKLGVGKSCSPSRPCQDDLRCTPDPKAEPSDEPPPATCEPKFDNAAPCETGDDCKGGFCFGPAGAEDGKACSARLALAFTAETCSSFR